MSEGGTAAEDNLTTSHSVVPAKEKRNDDTDQDDISEGLSDDDDDLLEVDMVKKLPSETRQVCDHSHP